MKYTDQYGDEYIITGSIAAYAQSPMCLAIQLYSQEKGSEFIEPYASLTVNLGINIGNDTYMPINCSFINTNHMSDAIDWLVREGAGSVYTRFGSTVSKTSGWCEYPLFQFNQKWLEKLDKKGYEDYVAGYRKAQTGWIEKKHEERELL